MIKEGPDHIEGLPFPYRCQCALCRLVSEVVDRCIETMQAMSVEDRTRSMNDFYARRWQWVWGDDGGVMVLMHGQVLGRMSLAGVRILCRPAEAVASRRQSHRGAAFRAAAPRNPR